MAPAVVQKAWTKLVQPTVDRGQTLWPGSTRDQLNFGIRFDYDGVITQGGVEYHNYQLQPNAGKIPASIAEWRKKNGGTHAVMSSILIKKGGTKDDVKEAIKKAFKDV